MRWTRILQRHGTTDVELQEGYDADPFEALVRNPDAPHATLSYSLKSNHPDFSRIGVSLSLTIRCPQNERHINMAAELCLRKATELINPATFLLGTPQLPTMPEP
jgi:hypothetical protein